MPNEWPRPQSLYGRDQTWGVCLRSYLTDYLPRTQAAAEVQGLTRQALGPLSKSPPSDTGGETEAAVTCYAWLHSGQFLLYLTGHLDIHLLCFNFLS